MRELFYALPSMLLVGIANAILKWRITFMNQNGIQIFSKQFLKFLFDPYIFAGAIATLMAILWWLNIISFVRVGVVYPLMQSGAILITLIISSFLLKENISLVQLSGIFLITMGIVLISK